MSPPLFYSQEDDYRHQTQPGVSFAKSSTDVAEGGKRRRVGERTAMEELAELERIQIRILERISSLEVSYLSGNLSSSLSVSSPPVGNSGPAAEVSGTEARLSAILERSGVYDFCFKRVPSDYYDRTFEERRDLLGAHSIDHLCKSIVMVGMFTS